jgi:hypothetical protein
VDATRVLETVVEDSKEVGYRRAIQIASQLLGDERFKAGLLEGAEAAYLESLAMCEQMGSVSEMAEMLVRIAVLRAETGRTDDAAEILFSVLADPVRDQSTLLSMVPVGEMATEALVALGVDPDVGRGPSTSIAVTAKELLSAR